MNDKEFTDTINDQDVETLETTKEVQTLKDLSITAIHNIESEYQADYDEEMDDADLIFKTVVDTKEEIKKETENESENDSLEKPQKESWIKKLQKKWNDLDKKKKILFILLLVLILVLIGVGLFFLFRKDEKPLEKKPNVILEMGSYRYENGSLVFLDAEEEIGRYECENKDENLCMMANLTQDDDFSEPKQVDQDGNPLSLVSNIYFDRFVFIVDHKDENDKSIKVYDLQDEKVLKTVFAVKAYEDYDNLVVLKNEESLYGLEQITETGLETVIPYSYDALGILPDQEEANLLAVRKDNNSYLADMGNKILTKAFNTSVVYATETHIVTKDEDDKYYVYDYNSTLLNEEGYDYIVPLDNVYLYVLNNQLYVSDYTGNKMIPAPYDLKNDAYNPVETYENYQLVSTEKAFDFALEGDRLNINIYNEDDYENFSVNLLEGTLSSKLAFMNYFNKTLYFYSDEEKESLLGTYSCKNENSVDGNTTTLSSCGLATDSFYREIIGNTLEIDHSEEVGAIPLINKQYVFIKDGDTIYLYDLVNKKELATYESVDTSSYTNMNSLTFANISELYFIAKSKTSGKFGVARITSDAVSPVLPFEYSSIKQLGEYYVVQSDAGYALYDIEGNKLTQDKNSPIVDYLEVDDTHKYLKTYKDNMYFVHTFDDEVSSNSYNYIELYNEYYAAVLNNRVHVYDYENNEITVTEDGESGLELHIDNYYGEGTKAFRVTFDNTHVYVEIGNTNNTYTDRVGFLKEKDSDGDES